MNFFAAVPKELEEAAFIDGANPLQVLTKIFIPISKAVLASVSLFSIVGSWNDFYSGLIYMSKAAYYPLMTYIQSLQINVEDLSSRAICLPWWILPPWATPTSMQPRSLLQLSRCC